MLGASLRQTVLRSFAAALVFASAATAAKAANCPAERPQPMVASDPALCQRLEGVVRRPSALPLPDFEQQLNLYFGNYCHRDSAAGWVRDKYLRDAGPFTATFGNGAWQGVGHGTHAPVVIWYSPEMVEWLRKNRPADGSGPATPPAVPDGAIMVKEMYPDAVLRLPRRRPAETVSDERRRSHDPRRRRVA